MPRMLNLQEKPVFLVVGGERHWMWSELGPCLTSLSQFLYIRDEEHLMAVTLSSCHSLLQSWASVWLCVPPSACEEQVFIFSPSATPVTFVYWRGR